MTTKIKPSVIEEMYDELKSKILNGTLLPGTKLSENGLSSDFHCSRTPVREALKRLEQESFVVILPHSGTYVKSPTLREYQEMTEIRAYLEALAFSLAIERKADCTVLAQILKEMDDLVQDPPFDVVAFGEKHYRFHRQMVVMSGNPLLLQAFERLNLNANSLLFYQSMTKESFTITQEEHHKILSALETGNAKMESFVLNHLWRKRNKFKKEADEKEKKE